MREYVTPLNVSTFNIFNIKIKWYWKIIFSSIGKPIRHWKVMGTQITSVPGKVITWPLALTEIQLAETNMGNNQSHSQYLCRPINFACRGITLFCYFCLVGVVCFQWIFVLILFFFFFYCRLPVQQLIICCKEDES